ncbi:MAG: hypothetical protein A2Y38_22615 [Spirochaetes bacterium GWB1_59_5]|nr:MAG: hypothetical protein A2Y38_22615 [Spirochaetes bacterium GWB1_59_5]
MLIALEGGDGVGKATQTKLLAERINRVGREAVIYSFPRYETEIGKAILRHLKNETYLADNTNISRDKWPAAAAEDAMMFQALCAIDKYEVAGDIRAHLRAGRFVICDRWTPSGIAFGSADGIDPKWLRKIQEQLPAADLNLWLNIPEEEALRRRPQLRDRYEKDRNKQAAVRAQYELLWNEHAFPNDSQWIKIDGTGTVDEVHARIWECVREAARARGMA